MCLAPVPSVTAGAGAARSHSRRAGGCGIQGERGGWREKPAAASKKSKAQRPWVIDRLYFKEDTVGYLDRRRTHLYVFKVASKAMKQVSSGDYDDTEPAWSPVESCWRSPRTARSATPTPRTLAAGKPRKIVHILNRVGEPLRFSPWRFSRYTCVLPSSPSAVLPRRKECQVYPIRRPTRMVRHHFLSGQRDGFPAVPRHHPYLRLVFVVLVRGGADRVRDELPVRRNLRVVHLAHAEQVVDAPRGAAFHFAEGE